MENINGIEVNGKEYELKYNLKRIELIESATNMPTMAEIQRTRGYFGVTSLKTYFAYGLKEKGSDAFEKPKIGMEICEELINSEGYENVCALVLENMQRDCPFFFQGA